MFKLQVDTPKEWLETVLSDFNTFLINHAACERKVSASNMSFIVRYPDRTEILEPIIKMAREELEHFHLVYKLIAARGLNLVADSKDEYVNLMLQYVRTGREERFLDRLILAAVMEARGFERLGLIAAALEDPELREFYQELTRCEARHHGQFIRLASYYFSEEVINKRLNEFIGFEAEAVSKLPIRPSLY
jgi:tRNA-(ms[2]io[6]A)-hydroxylase